MQLTLGALDGAQTGGAVRRGREHGGPVTRAVTRGVCRMLAEFGFATLTEFRLANHRRVDVMALAPGGEFVIVEVKSTVEDFRGDTKWPAYLPFCEQFYFAVPEGFPVDLLPDGCGLMVADRFVAVIRRTAPKRSLNGIRKRHQLLRFARTAGARLQALSDPRA